MAKRVLTILGALALFLCAVTVGRADTIFIPLIGGGDETLVTPAVAPYPDAPQCATHNPTAYHGLWLPNAGCHQDHTHYLDPEAPAVVAIFGNYTNWTGQEVSYDWQTFVGAAPGYPTPPSDPELMENAAKHAGYKFDFYDFPPAEYGCPQSNQVVKAVPNAWLIERHSLGHKGDFMARVHSVWAMVRFCIPGSPGEVAWLYTGGWQDFGQRISPYQGHIFPIPGSPSPTYPSPRAPYIAHACINDSECGGQNESNTSWISFAQMIPGHKLFGFGFRTNDSQQKIDVTNGFDQPDPPFVYLCSDGQGGMDPHDCPWNNSASHAYQLTAVIPGSYDLLDGVDDDRVNYSGYTDRWGNIVQGCTQNGLDCVPVYIDNLPVGQYHVNIAQYGFETVHEGLPDFDVCFDGGAPVDCRDGGTPSGWIGPEN